MPKGQKGYLLGSCMMINNMACGRTYTGDERQTKAQIAMHKKHCEICKKCDIHINEVSVSAWSDNAAAIIAKDAKTGENQYIKLTGDQHTYKAIRAARDKLAELSATK